MTTYTKLKDGSWGIRSTVKLTKGGQVSVTKKDGSIKTETVKAILWTGDGITLASIGSNGHGGRQYGRRRCITDGNCSSFGSGRNCGGEDCDGY